jgi:hypothetical protein
MGNSSWMYGTCRKCGYEVVVTQPDIEKYPAYDYWWYCSNKKCACHQEGEHTGDQEIPEWVIEENTRPNIIETPGGNISIQCNHEHKCAGIRINGQGAVSVAYSDITNAFRVAAYEQEKFHNPCGWPPAFVAIYRYKEKNNGVDQ